jgi:DNA-binding IclR family transcriptional regulator
MKSKSRRTTGVGSSRKVLNMLMSFTEQRPRITAEGLANAIGVPLSTAYRYIALLREVGLVEEDRRNSFALSSLVVPMARAARAANSLLDVAEPAIRQLSEQTNETALLIKRIDHQAVCIARVDSNKPIRLSFEIGRPVPLVGGAAGKVLLAAMPQEERESYLAELNRNGSGSARPRLTKKELEAIERNQWAISSGEVDLGVWAAAAAVTDGKDVLAALTVAGLADQYSESHRSRILTAVRKSAGEISERMTALRF